MKNLFIFFLITYSYSGWSCDTCIEIPIEFSGPCSNCYPDGWLACGEFGGSPHNNDIGTNYQDCAGSDSSDGGYWGELIGTADCYYYQFEDLIPGAIYTIGFEILTCSNHNVEAEAEFELGDFSQTYFAPMGQWMPITFCFKAGDDNLLRIGVNSLSYLAIDALDCGTIMDMEDCDLGIELLLDEDGIVCPGDEHQLESELVGCEILDTPVFTWSSEPPSGINYLNDLTIPNPIFKLPIDHNETVNEFTITLTVDLSGCTYEEEVTIEIIPTVIPEFFDIILCEDGTIDDLPFISNNGYVGFWEGEYEFDECVGDLKDFTFVLEPGQFNCLERYDTSFFINPLTLPSFDIDSVYCISDSQLIWMPIESIENVEGDWTFKNFKPYELGVGTFTNRFIPDDILHPCVSPIDLTIIVHDNSTLEFTLPESFCLQDNFIFPDTTLAGINGSWSIPNLMAITSAGNYQNTFTAVDSICAPPYTIDFIIYNHQIDTSLTPPSSCQSDDGQINIISSDTLEYSIDNGTSWTSSKTFSNLSAGNYEILFRLNAVDNCANSIMVSLIGNDMPTIDSLRIIDQLSCTTASGQLTVHTSLTEPVEYSIDNGNSWQSSPIYQNINAGNYEIWIRYTSDPTCITTQAFEILNAELPILQTVFIESISDCNLRDGELQIVASGTDLTFSIDNGASWQSQTIFSNLPSGSYTILIRSNNNDDCIIEQNVFINEPEPLSITTDIIIPSDCNSQDGSIIVIPDITIEEIEYSIDNGVSWQSSNVFENLDLGNYIIIARIKNRPSCLDDTIVSIDNVMAQISTNFEMTPIACDTQTGSITALTSQTNVEFSLDEINWTTNPVFDSLPAGVYELSFRFECDDFIVSITDITVTELSLPVIGLNITNPNCGADDGSIMIETIDTNIEYSLDGGISWQNENAFTQLENGSYTLAYRFISDPSCIDYLEVTLENSTELKFIDVIIEDNDSCLEDIGSIDIIATPNEIEYSIDGGLSWRSSNLYENLSDGNYDISIRLISDPDCFIDTLIVINPAEPVLIDNISTSNPIECDSEDGIIDIVSSQNNLEYSIDNGQTWQAESLFENLAEGDYTCLIRSIEWSDCQDIQTISLVAPDCPCDDYNLEFNLLDISCDNFFGLIEIILESDETITWSDGTSNPLLDNLTESQWYYFEITYDGGLCMYADSVFLNVIPPIEFGLQVLPNDCEDVQSGQVEIIDVSGGTGEYNYSLDGISFQSQSGFYNLSTAEYEAFVSDLNGCVTFEAFSIELASPPLEIDLMEIISIEQGDTIYLNPLIDINSVNSFVWEDMNNILELEGLVAAVAPIEDTEYTLTINYGNDCVLIRTILIQVTQDIDIYIPNIINGSGSDNGLFYIQSSSQFDIDIDLLQIFDRWGNKVFINENFKVNDPSEGWDGRQGYQVIQGVYTYRVDFKLDGKPEVQFGTVTLIR